MPRNEITDRDTITDTVAVVMSEEYRSTSIDTLLTRPHDAIAMATAVCRRLGKRASKEQINEICRAALAARKRGDLKRDRV